MKNDFLPTASIESLRTRATIIAQVHDFFVQRGFFHVETPLISRDTVIDRYLEPIPVNASDVLKGNPTRECYWLQTSPEFGMKRLLAAGAESIYQIGKVFRAAESGQRHNPEFTMLEWYRTGDDLHQGMDLLAEFVESLLNRSNTVRITYRELFQQFIQCDPLTCRVEQLQAAAQSHALDVSSFESGSSRDEWLNLLLAQLIEPQLGFESPVIVYDWPASQSALAQVRTDNDVEVAERFEIYVDGVELANGYHELLDAAELARRNAATNRQRVEDGNAALPVQSRLLHAMQHGLPACAGVALGIDRLVMIHMGVASISEVVAFPIDRA